ncbi:MAG: replication factor C large subunit [Candidatus Micrarchaeia archaeon]
MNEESQTFKTYDTLFEPESLDEIIGNKEAIMQLKKYAADINNNIRRKPLIIYGPPGVGKTMAVNMLAKTYKWHIVELNASDYRDKESIDKLLTAASQSRTLFGSKNLIFLDEIDELSAKFDKGASSALVNLINDSKNPIIFTANDVWDKRITFLRERTEQIKFNNVSAGELSQFLTNLSLKHNIKVDKETIEYIANHSNGDIRSAILDLFVLNNAPSSYTEIIGMRDRKIDIFTTLDKIFLANTYSAPLIAIQNSDVENAMLMQWIDENITNRYSNLDEIASAYKMLSLGSLFFNRASKTQYYTYWRYMNVFISSGIALSKHSYPNKYKRYTFPKRISELSKSKESRNKLFEIASLMRKKIHTGTSKIMNSEIVMIAYLIRRGLENNKENKEDVYSYFERTFNIEEKQVDWLIKNVY